MDEVEVGHGYTKVRLAEFDNLLRENTELKATVSRYQFALADTEAVLLGTEERLAKLSKPFSPAEHGAHVGDVFNRQRIENLEAKVKKLEKALKNVIDEESASGYKGSNTWHIAVSALVEKDKPCPSF